MTKEISFHPIPAEGIHSGSIPLICQSGGRCVQSKYWLKGYTHTDRQSVCVCIRKGIYTEEEKEGEAIFRRTRLCSNAHTEREQTRHKVVCVCVPPLSRYDKQKEKSCRAEEMLGRRSNLNKSLPIPEEEELKECLLLIHPNNWEQRYNSTVEFVKKREANETSYEFGPFPFGAFFKF